MMKSRRSRQRLFVKSKSGQALLAINSLRMLAFQTQFEVRLRILATVSVSDQSRVRSSSMHRSRHTR